MTKKLLLLLTLSFCLNRNILAQTKKVHADPFIWTELQADYFLKDQSFFFFRNMYRHNTNSAFPGLKESGVLSHFYLTYFQLGYDQKLTEHWRAAVSARYTFDARNNNQIYLAYLQHNGKIGQTDFIKRLSYDIMNFKEGESRGRLRPRFTLERNVDFGRHRLRPGISYELFFYNNFNPDQTEIATRTVDRTRLRITLSYKVSPHFWITPYFMKQTEFYNVLPTYVNELDADGNLVLDPDGNPVLIEKEPGGKRNRIEPIFGLDLRIIIPGKNISEKTVPNLGNGPIE
ncbi:DUF2490 domain-containing protein [Adhaeribacter sp. BT258]|uniref:DUF2490 domain-containing protein n=1 Tax=Adhaeribacter terrigena TaxID=2793070 RepID=A0ABS1BWS1_9BACT|nr:DUF2490 domain-containing protein [Adhaeribacter terrigena]MBK0401453.1 DUF2490 domain-containing protein [Adhaeribacter terrigena]